MEISATLANTHLLTSSHFVEAGLTVGTRIEHGERGLGTIRRIEASVNRALAKAEVARGTIEGALDAPFVVHKSGVLSVVDVACVEEMLRSGGSVQICTRRGMDMSMLGPASAALLTDTVVAFRPDAGTRLVHDEPGLLNVKARAYQPEF